MKRYPAYQDGIYDWWQKVPAHWSKCSMRSILTLCDERRNDRDEELLSVYRELGVIRKNSRMDNHNVESADLSKYKMVYPGNLVMNKMKMWQGSLGVSSFRGIVSPAYIVCKVAYDDKIDRRFFHLLLRSTSFKTFYNRISYGIRVGQWDMDYSDFRTLTIFLPSLSEQRQIVRYLDWKTAQIDRAIRGYERLIALLEERKTAVINEAVTKGVRRGIVTKKSGVNWLDKIPQHWEMRYAKQLFALRRDKAREDDEQLTSSQKYGIISQREFMEREGRRVTVVLKGEDILKHVEAGDFVISMRSFQGGLEYSHVSGKISSAYVMLIPNHDFVYDRYFRWLFKSESYIRALQGTSDLIRDGQALRYTNFAKVYLPCIPLNEQKEIADYIDREVRRIDNAMMPIAKQIDLLRERRTRLISDVVTGQVDVRDVVVPDREAQDDGDEYDGAGV